MKIRRKVQGAEELAISPEVPVETSCPYQGAIDNIMAAIDSLAKLPDDQLAKDSIANLSVVILDLKC